MHGEGGLRVHSLAQLRHFFVGLRLVARLAMASSETILLSLRAKIKCSDGLVVVRGCLAVGSLVEDVAAASVRPFLLLLLGGDQGGSLGADAVEFLLLRDEVDLRLLHGERQLAVLGQHLVLLRRGQLRLHRVELVRLCLASDGAHEAETLVLVSRGHRGRSVDNLLLAHLWLCVLHLSAVAHDVGLRHGGGLAAVRDEPAGLRVALRVGLALALRRLVVHYAHVILQVKDGIGGADRLSLLLPGPPLFAALQRTQIHKLSAQDLNIKERVHLPCH